MSKLPIHRCEDSDCPSLGQRTSKSCRCHVTGEQMLVDQRDALLASLKQALRYIEVNVAYRGAMTAAEVEAAILLNSSMSRVEIAANSVSTLAIFNFEKARAAIAKAEGEI